jgi:hypothetical protein
VLRLDLAAMYANAITSRVMPSVRIPATMDSDREAILAAVKTCGARDLARVRLVLIPDTLHLRDLWVSEALLDDARGNPALELAGPLRALEFDAGGRLAP